MRDKDHWPNYIALIPDHIYRQLASTLSPYSVAMLDYFVNGTCTFLHTPCHIFDVHSDNGSYLDYINPGYIEKKAQEISISRGIEFKKEMLVDAFNDIIRALNSDEIFLYTTALS